jgi:hypothetical protein
MPLGGYPAAKELPSSRPLDSVKLRHPLSLEELLGLTIPEAPDHAVII